MYLSTKQRKSRMCFQQLKTILIWIAQRQPFLAIMAIPTTVFLVKRLFLVRKTTVPQPASERVFHAFGQYRIIRADDADPSEIRALDSQDLEIHCPLDNGRHGFGPISQDLGTLSIPPELVWLIINHLDIPSLTTFRRVSKRAMHMVDTTLEYQQIMNRAPQMYVLTETNQAASLVS